MTESKSNQKKTNSSTKKNEDSLKDIVALAKRRGFVFPGSDIYGGLSNTFDYGPYGTELLLNIKNAWWKSFVQDRDDVVGLDSSILLHPLVWKASGHVDSFTDPLIDCKSCKSRFRADKFLEDTLSIDSSKLDLAGIREIFTTEQEKLKCPTCGKTDFTEPRQFNLMFETKMGAASGSDQSVYLRPETAQGIFINFKNVVDTCRVKVPFGIAQIGKSFRNEIIARQFVFRTREFEQMEMEFFCKPGTQKEWFDFWTNYCLEWLYGLGLNKGSIRTRAHEPQELAFYSEGTIDIEFNFPFGWGELWGIASRTDYDLKQHIEYSKKNLDYQDPETREKYIPYVIEPSLGVNRLFLAILSDAYRVENEGSDSQRVVLSLHPSLSPVKAGIFPLTKKDGLPEIGQSLHKSLSKLFPVDYDVSGSIGKRYYRQDELGTPYCITIDHQTKEDQTVTMRERDSTNQERISIDKVRDFLIDHITA